MRLNVGGFISGICPLSWELLTRTLAACCLLLLGAIFILIAAGAPNAWDIDTYHLAREMCACAQGSLFVSVVCAAIIDERARA